MSSTVFMTTSSYSKNASEIISKSTTITTTITQTSYHTFSSSSSTLIIQATVTNVPIPPTPIVPTSNVPIAQTPIPSSLTSNMPNPPPTNIVPISPTTSTPNPPSNPPTYNVPTSAPSLETMSHLSSITPTVPFSSSLLMASLTSNEPSSIITASSSITTTAHKIGSTVTTVHTSPILLTTEALGSTMMLHSSSNISPSFPTAIPNRTSTNTLTPTIQGTGTKDHTFSILLAVISTVFILLAVSILVILIVSVLVCRRRKQLILEIPGEGNDSNSNPVYSLNSITQKEEEEVGLSNPNYQIQMSQGKYCVSLCKNMHSLCM